MVNWEDYIEQNPEVMVGKPVVKGTRLTVEHVVGLLAGGWPIEDILHNFPGLTQESIRACLAYAHELLESEVSLAPMSALK